MRHSPALFWHCPFILHICMLSLSYPRPVAILQIGLVVEPSIFGTGSVTTDLRHGLWSLKTRRELRAVVAGAQVEQMVRRGRQRAVQRRGFQEALQHATGASVLETLVRGQGVLSPVPSVAELTDVQGVGLLVLVLEVSFQGIVTRECPAAVGTLLRLVDAAGRRRRHTEGRYSCKLKICIIFNSLECGKFCRYPG